MNVCKNEAGNLLPISVTEGITVNVIPSKRHDFFTSTKEVATGYGTSKHSVFKSLDRNSNDFVEGRHYVRGVDILSTHRVCQPNSIMWTKAGVVRLGFFIKSDRAKLFRDWAENLILKIDEQTDLFGAPVPVKRLPKKRRHNRLTLDRINRLMADICKIDDKELRLRLANEIMGDN